MKRVSHKTITNRIKNGKYICPVCGCTGRRRNTHNVGYPDIWLEETCSRCGRLLCWADNTPTYEVCDEIRRLKHITYKGCLKIAEWFNEY